MWASGDYPSMVETFLLPLGPRLVEACGIAPGRRVLDVAPGTGNAAIPAAQRGARGHRQRPHARAVRGGPRAGARPASSSSGPRPTPSGCRSRTPRSTSSCRRSASCSRRITRTRPTSCPRPPPGRDARAPELDARRHARRAVRDHEAVRPAAAPGRPGAAAVGRRGAPPRAPRRPRRVPLDGPRAARDHRLRAPARLREHFKERYGPTIAARANAARNGREAEFDAALDAFCDEWNRGTADHARFDKEYLLTVATRK